MQSTITQNLHELARFRHQEPGQIIAEAIEIGLWKMWIDVVLAQYLKKKISRRKAIQLVGLDIVKLAEHQDRIAQSDLRWGWSYASNRS